MQRLLLLLVLTLMTACSNRSWQPETSNEQQSYQVVLKRVNEIEPYSNFLAIEKPSLNSEQLPASYYQARWQFLKQLAITNPDVPRVTPQVKKFVKQVKELHLFTADSKNFAKAARTLGHELITDKLAFDGGSGNYKQYLNIPYTDYKGYAQKLDLFVPKSAKNVPAVVFIHGGGWQVHKRAWFEAFARYFAQRGYAAVTIDYRKLHSTDSPMAAIHDAKAAVRWLRQNASQYGIDPDRIGAAGASAGAHLTTTLATTFGDPKFEGIYKPQVSSQIQAAVGFATPAMTGKRTTWPINKRKGKESWFSDVSPFQNFRQNAAPMKFIHGKNDRLVSYLEAQDLHKKYQQHGLTSELELIEGAGHVFYMNEEFAEKARLFFNKIFNYQS